MNCKFCDAPLDEGSSICPACGVDNAQADDELTPEEGVQQQETELPGDVDGDLYEDETIYTAAEQSSDDAQPAEEMPAPKKSGKGLLITLGIVAVAAVAALVLAFTGVLGGKSDAVDPTDVNMVDKDGVFIAHDFVKDTMTAEEAATVVAKAGKQEMTNADLSFYFWQQYYGLYNSYGMYISMILDTTKPLSEQMYDETHSWQDMLLQVSMTAFRQGVALEEAAAKAGFTLPAEHEAYIQSMNESLTAEAEASGFENVDALLQSVYGPYATMDGYLSYARTTMLGSAYMQEMFKTISTTDADITAYFDANADQFQGMSKEDPNMVNVRHILIKPVADEGAAVDETTGQPVYTDENWAAAEKTAEEIYDQWQAGEATEASFSALAAEHSADASAQNGGLIENIYPGQMVEEFGAWCFDADRKVGDHAIVKTQFGYHIMYFSAVGEHPYWFTQAQSALVSQRQQEMMEELTGKIKLKVDYDKVVLVEAAQEESTEAPAEAPAADAAP